MEPIVFQAIGVIRTPFTEVTGMPVQASVPGGTPGRIELLPTFVDGLQDLDGFGHPRIGWYAGRLDRLGDARSDRRFG